MDELNDILFDACRDGKVEVIKFIIENNPNLVIKKGAQNNTALHVACENGLLLDGIKILYEACPGALTIFNDQGASPFHMSCVHGTSVTNLMFLHEKMPIGIVTANVNGDLPMHWLSEDASEELVEYLLEQFPTSAEVKNKEGALPIHVACNKGLSLNIIRLLHAAHPEGILQPDNDGMLPIHHACEGSTNLELIKLLYEMSPVSFEKVDNEGNLALHYAVSSSPEIVNFVTEANKSALQKSNNYGFLPIHEACNLSVEMNIIKMLNENYPEGVRAKTPKGHLPFHLATTSRPILEYLYELFDDAVKTPDEKGRYPIHIACEQGASLDVITFLAENCLIAIREADYSQMLPLHHAIVNKLPFSIIKYLVEFYPGALRYADANHHLPFHLVFLHSNDLEIFYFLRDNYDEEFEELIVNPTIKDDNNVSSSRNSYKRALSLQQNKTSIEQKYSYSKDKKRMRFEEACASADRSDKFEDTTAEGDEDESLLSDSELDSSSDYDYCPSINSVDKIKNNSQYEPKETRIKENIKFKREDVSLPEEKRRRISTTTNALGSTAVGESGIKDQFNSASAVLEDNDKKVSLNSNSYGLVRVSSTSKYWSEYEVEAVKSALRNFIASDEANECLYNYISRIVKTKKPRQCFDFVYRTKRKVERNKKYTSNEYMIYKLLKSYNDNILPTFRTGKSPRKDDTNATTKSATLSHPQRSSLPSSLPSHVLLGTTTNYDDIDSVQNRKRIGSMRASTIASAFAYMSENDNKPKIQPEPSLSDSEILNDKHEKSTKNNDMNNDKIADKIADKITDKITDKYSFIPATSFMKWSEDEIEVVMVTLRSFIATNGANECMYKHISETIKTRNSRQCYDFLRRIKTKVESNKRHTFNEYNIYKLLKDYNDYNLPTYRTGKSARKSNTKVTTKVASKVTTKLTTLSQSQHSSSPSLSPSHTLLSAMSSRKKGSFTKNEIEAYISALQDFGGTNKRGCLFNYISQKVKTRDLKQCYDFAYRIKKKVEIYKKYTIEDNLMYNLLKSYTNYDLSSSKKSKSPLNDNAKNNSNATTSSLSQHSPSPSSQAPITPSPSYNKGSWTQREIEIFISALHSANKTIKKKDLFDQIAIKVKTRNCRQCHDFPRTSIKRVESSQSPSSEDFIIYKFFKNYDKDKIINNDDAYSSIEVVGNSTGNSSLKDTDDNSKSSPSQHSPSPTQPSPSPIQHAPSQMQHSPSPMQHSPPPLQQLPSPSQHSPSLMQHSPPPLQQLPSPLQHSPSPSSAVEKNVSNGINNATATITNDNDCCSDDNENVDKKTYYATILSKLGS